MQLFKLILTSLLFFLSATCFSNDLDENQLNLNDFVSAKNIIDNKIYLESEMIYLTSNQIFLNIENNFLPIEHLSTDAEGIFITLEEFLMAAREEKTWPCRRCNTINMMEDRWCIRCGRHWSGK